MLSIKTSVQSSVVVLLSRRHLARNDLTLIFNTDKAENDTLRWYLIKHLSFKRLTSFIVTNFSALLIVKIKNMIFWVKFGLQFVTLDFQKLLFHLLQSPDLRRPPDHLFPLSLSSVYKRPFSSVRQLMLYYIHATIRLGGLSYLRLTSLFLNLAWSFWTFAYLPVWTFILSFNP